MHRTPPPPPQTQITVGPPPPLFLEKKFWICACYMIFMAINILDPNIYFKVDNFLSLFTHSLLFKRKCQARSIVFKVKVAREHS